MRIGLNLLPIPKQYGGSGRYALNLLKAFPENPDFKKHEFFVYYSNQIHDYIKDIDPAFKLRRFNLRSIPQRI
ncbi:MAG: hypothetical protein PHV06_10545, partial [bacterium]|nr:hypothetical protein [bacterium]